MRSSLDGRRNNLRTYRNSAKTYICYFIHYCIKGRDKVDAQSLDINTLEKLKSIGITDPSILNEFDPNGILEYILNARDGLERVALASRISETIPEISRENAYSFILGRPISLERGYRSKISTIADLNRITSKVHNLMVESNIDFEQPQGDVELIRRLGFQVSNELLPIIGKQFANDSIDQVSPLAEGFIDILGQRMPILYQNKSFETISQMEFEPGLSVIDMTRGARIWQSISDKIPRNDYSIEISLDREINGIIGTNYELAEAVDNINWYSLGSNTRNIIINLLETIIKNSEGKIRLTDDFEDHLSARLNIGRVSNVYLDSSHLGEITIEFSVTLKIQCELEVYSFIFPQMGEPELKVVDIPDIKGQNSPDPRAIHESMQRLAIYGRSTIRRYIPVREDSGPLIQVSSIAEGLPRRSLDQSSNSAHTMHAMQSKSAYFILADKWNKEINGKEIRVEKGIPIITRYQWNRSTREIGSFNGRLKVHGYIKAEFSNMNREASIILANEGRTFSCDGTDPLFTGFDSAFVNNMALKAFQNTENYIWLSPLTICPVLKYRSLADPINVTFRRVNYLINKLGARNTIIIQFRASDDVGSFSIPNKRLLVGDHFIVINPLNMIRTILEEKWHNGDFPRQVPLEPIPFNLKDKGQTIYLMALLQYETLDNIQLRRENEFTMTVPGGVDSDGKFIFKKFLLDRRHLHLSGKARIRIVAVDDPRGFLSDVEKQRIKEEIEIKINEKELNWEDNRNFYGSKTDAKESFDNTMENRVIRPLVYPFLKTSENRLIEANEILIDVINCCIVSRGVFK